MSKLKTPFSDQVFPNKMSVTVSVSIMVMAGLCQENTEGRVHTLLYIKTSTTSTTGHVDLAERVSKTFWKDSIIRPDWLLPTPHDLTYTRRSHVNYCSSTFWDVNIKDSVVKLRHIRYPFSHTEDMDDFVIFVICETISLS